MKILLALLALFLLSGCQPEKPSPFVGEWNSSGTGAAIRLSEGGDCRYFKTKAAGLVCEWESIGDRKGRFTIKRNGAFAEGEIKIILDELWLSTPSGGLDIFARPGSS